MGWANYQPEQHSTDDDTDRVQLPKLHDNRISVHLHPKLLLHHRNCHIQKQPVQLHSNTLDDRNISLSVTIFFS